MRSIAPILFDIYISIAVPAFGFLALLGFEWSVGWYCWGLWVITFLLIIQSLISCLVRSLIRAHPHLRQEGGFKVSSSIILSVFITLLPAAFIEVARNIGMVTSSVFILTFILTRSYEKAETKKIDPAK